MPCNVDLYRYKYHGRDLPRQSDWTEILTFSVRMRQSPAKREELLHAATQEESLRQTPSVGLFLVMTLYSRHMISLLGLLASFSAAWSFSAAPLATKGCRQTSALHATVETNEKITIRETHNRQSWNKGFHTVQSESCYPLDASFPKDLVGTFFQNGHAKFNVNDELVIHPFDGDGMITAVTFQDGKAWFRNRFVQTKGYVEELQAHRILYRGVFGTARNRGQWWSNILRAQIKNVANTHVLFSENQQELYALWEAGKPVQMDPVTLETRQVDSNLQGTLEDHETYAAHYKVDPTTGHIISFAVSVASTSSMDPNKEHEVTIYEHTPDLQLLSKQKYVLPGFGLAHDVAISTNYVAMFQTPATFDPLPFLLGRKGIAECIAMDSEAKTAKLHLIPRTSADGSASTSASTEPICIDIPIGFTFHISNAFEENGEFVVDVNMADDLKMTDTEVVGYPERPLWETFDFANSQYALRRYRIDIKTRQMISMTDLSSDASSNIDFPVVNPRVVGQPYTYAYVAASAGVQTAGPLQGLAKLNTQEGKTVEKWLPETEHEYVSECVFVPRSASGAEDDGYLLAYLMNGQTESTSLVVLDAANISAGPIAQAPLQTYLSHALHGTFAAGFTPSIEECAGSFSQ